MNTPKPWLRSFTLAALATASGCDEPGHEALADDDTEGESAFDDDDSDDDGDDGDLQSSPDSPANPPQGPDTVSSGDTDGTSAAGGWANPTPLIMYDFIKAGGVASLTNSDLNLSGRTWNTGQAVTNDIGSLFVPAGREATACSKPAYRGNCQRLGPNLPGYVYALKDFSLDNTVESIEFRPLGGIDWTSSNYQSNYPNHRNNEISPDIQGIAHSASHWFIANTHEIARVPITSDLNAKSYGGPELHVGDIPGGCNHIGDPDYYSGELFIPLEGCDGGNWFGGDRIAVYHIDAGGNFTFDRQLLLGNQDHAPWVAINPINGRMYSSDYDDPGNTVVHVYNRNFTDGALIKGQLYRVFLPRHFHGVQGGTFDPDGNLYLTDHAGDDTGIYSYQIAGGKVVDEGFIGPNGYNPGGVYGQEIEGIDWWDLSTSTAKIPGIKTGPGAAQLHWLLLDNDLWDKDEFWFKHVRVD